jgi:hypothetical protein
MAKTKKVIKSKAKMKLDVMSIIVILVIALFTGLIGFYMGHSVGANDMLQTVQQMVR